MADVFGNIGNEQVELNNAATEATLKLLLQSSIASNKQSIESINKIAIRAGVDENTVKQTNQRIGAFGQAAMATGASWAGLSVATKQLNSAFSGTLDATKILTSGAAEASSVLNIMARMDGPLGKVFAGMSMLASFQETQLKQYQTLTSAGISFGGSLTDLRLAASGAGLTMDQFTGILTRNSERLTSLGGTANEGAIAFKKLAANMYASETGAKLRAMGITAEQQNEAMITYMSLSGGRSKKELADTEGQIKATANYLTQLDELAQITGKTKEEQEKKLKAEMEAADFQLFLATKSEAERKTITDSMTRATALYGQAGADIVKAQAMGVAVQGEAGKRLTALSSGTADSIKNDLEIRKQYGNDTAKLNANEMQGRKANANDMGKLAGAVGSYGGAFKGAEDAVKLAAKDKLLGEKGIQEQYGAVAEERRKREASQAAAATETQTAINKLGQSIMQNLMPVVAAILPVFNSLAQALAGAVEWLMKSPIALGGLITAIGLVVAGFTALKVAQAVSAARELARTGGRKLGTPGAPMIVREVGGGAGTGGEGKGGKETKKPDTKSTTGAKGVGKIGSLAKGLAGGVGGVLGGLALGAASDYAKEKGMEKTGAGLDIGSAALSGAGTGAMLGSIVPGVGTAIGGALGGLAGGAYGLYQNFDTLFGGKGNNLAKPSAAEEAKNAATELSPVTDASRAMLTIEDPIEKLVKQMERLNMQTTDAVRYLKETAEQTRRNVDATKQLGGNLFPTP